MQNLRILTFNWHDPYLAMFSRVGHRVEVGDWMSRADGTTGWDLQKRPLPDNLSLIRDARQAAEMLRSGGCDLVLCHTVQDLAFVAPFDVPTVFLTHNALHNDAMNDPEQIQKIRSEVGRFLAGREGVFAAISPMKLKSWDLDGFVVRPGIHLEDYSGYTGKEAAALAVGNLFVERDFMLGYRYLREIVEGVPHKIVGKNPTLPQARKAESWEDLKAAYREYRVYVNTTVEAFEDGYNLGMLEAMATGMPVVALKNATSPIRDGENGYISDDTGRLRDRVKALLKDEVLARKLGQAARKTVAEMFSVDVFVQNWNEIFEACLSRAGRANRSAVSVKLTFGQEDVYPFTAADVSTFLSVPDLGRITVPALKLDRLGEAYLCDVFLYDLETDRQMVWQGLEVYLEGEAVRVAWPAFLAGLEEGVRAQVEQVVSAAVQEVVRQGVSGASVHVGLQEVAGFTPRVGEDRVTPGDARSDIFLHHAKRYAFARPFCKNKQVVDIGSGTGYGSQILARDATRVVSVDLSVDAHRYAARTFSGAPIHRLAGDIRAIGLRDGSFDTAVCFEAIEHIREHEDFLEEVCRLLRPDGTFVVSTPNKRYYDLPENENPYHVGMLELEAFRALLSRHFENVQVYGQKRMQTGASYYEAFDFRDGAREEDEVFVAVCREPRAGESTEMAQGRAPAVHVKGAQRAGRGRPLKVLVSQVSNPISAGRYVVDAFRQAHEVLTCGPVIDTDELAQWREAEKQHALKPPGAGEVEKMGLIARLARPCDIPMPRGQVDIQQALERLPKGWRPDLFVWVDSATGFLPMGLEKLDCPAACLVGDTHTGQMDWRLKYAQMFRDVFLMFNRQHIPNFQDAGCSRVHWLPGACDPKVHGRIEAEKSYDVGFVGQTHRQWHPHRVRLLERLVQAGFDVHIESKILEEMALFYSRSKIVFNRSLNNDLNMRVYEAMCSGSLLLSDRLPAESGLGDLFQDREHLVLYDEENLEEVARYYLEHESEREAIAARGRNAVLAGHTYAHRVDQMVEAVFEAEADGIAKCVEEKERVPARSGRVSVAENPPGEDAVCELAEYTGERPEVVRERLPKAGVALAQEWNQGDRNSEVGVDAFYKETNEYLYDLTHFNYTPMYTGWRGAIYNLCQQVSESMADFQVLDYGGGIGTTLIDLADLPGVRLSYADLPGKTFEYAQWRFGQRGLDVEMVSLGEDDALADRAFDVIVCLDVLEHLVDPEKAVGELIERLKPGGVMVLTVTFYTNEQGPFHLNCDRYTNESFYEIVRNMGMEELSRYSPRVFRKGNPASRVGDLGPGKVAVSSGAQGQNSELRTREFIAQWSGPVRLNLGCGEDRREGYINVDAYVASADLQMDIFQLEFGEAEVDEIFSSHMLEHLGKYEVPRALGEWYRVLRPGGVLRLNLPDLEWCMTQWLAAQENQRWGWHLDTLYGLQTHPGEYHKTGFTAARVEQLLTEAGFAQVRVSWSWSHGMRCLWVEAARPQVGEFSGVVQGLDLAHFAGQFPVEMSGMVSYSAAECEAFFGNTNWQIVLVSFEKLPMDPADCAINVVVKNEDQQMVLQGYRLFGLKQNPVLVAPEYLRGVPAEAQERLNQAIGQVLSKTLSEPGYQEGSFVVARFEEGGGLGLEQHRVRVIPGLTESALYIPGIKRYLLAQEFAEGARVLDAGCGTGYGARLLAQAGAQVDAVDVREDVIAFAKRTYGHKRIQWRVADLRALEPEAGAYDLVTSFGLVEQLDREEVQDYLEQLKRALKPGGTALISIRGQEAGQAVDGKESFREMAAAVFGKVDMLGQRPWSEQTELTGQCVVSGRVADDDGGVVVVCKKRAVSAAPEMGEAPRVSIVMPLYNKVEYTEACLKGLEEAAGKTPCELVLVDNGSSDGTGALLDRMERRARVIRCGENLGFSRGNNLGAGYARGEYLLFLNNDIVPHAGWLDAMVAEVDADPEVGIVGARLLYPDSGKVQHAGIELVNGTPDHVYRNVPGDDPGVMKSRDLDMVTGACLLIRKEVFEQLGGFDEAYVNGVEDVDLCLKVRKKGYRVRYCADAVLDHYEGTSEGRYSHVRPNLERFVKRWNGQFDAQGRFIAPAPRAETALRGCWEGTQFVYHSLSLVNMALTSELIRSGQCELKLIPYEAATFGVEVDPERYSPIAERINAALSGPAQFHVRHMWPPNFTPPPEGHWVMIQPWEFGKIPEEWVAPIQEGVDEVWVPSSYVKQCYVEGGVDADRVQVIPNGVRTDLFRPDAPPMKLDTEKTFKFLFVGGMIFRKGIDVLLKAYTETFRRWDDVCLVVKTMGSETFYKGQAPEEMIQKIQADPDAPEILFLTQELSEEEMAGLYTACNCLTHPYRGEGFGLPVAEAMACGLPVMVTAGGACDDFCAEDRAYFIPATRKEVSVRW